MIVVVMQPTFMPWLGYFDLIDRADAFVYLDTVEHSKRSWQQRNRIKTPQGLAWLTVPVHYSRSEHTRLDEVRVADAAAVRKMRSTLAHTYARAAHRDAELPWIDAWLAGIETGRSLADVNVDFIERVCARLGITTPRHRASALPVGGDRSGRLAAFCTHFGADTYLSPVGSADYLEEDARVFRDAGVRVVFQAFEHPSYRQLHGDFAPYASVVDVILNEGAAASIEILRSGRRPALAADSVFRREGEFAHAP